MHRSRVRGTAPRYEPCHFWRSIPLHQFDRSNADEGVPLTAAQILVREDDAAARRALAGAPEYGWYLFGWMGVVFAAVGLLDLALAWYPFEFGNPQWEFGTVSRTYDTLPITALGLTLLLGSGVARGTRWWVRTVGIVFLLMGLVVAAGLVLYALNIPLALSSVADNELASLGIKRAVVKALGQGVLYAVAFVVLGISALRHSVAGRARS